MLYVAIDSAFFNMCLLFVFLFHSSEKSRRECAMWFMTTVPSCSRQCQPSFGSKKEGCKFQKKVRVYMKDSPLLCIYVFWPVVWQVKTILPKCVYVYTWHTFFSLFETEPCHTPCSFSLSLLCARTWKFTVVVTCLLERVLCFMGQVSWPDHPDAFS